MFRRWLLKGVVNMDDCPSIYALVCVATGSVEYTSDREKSVLGFFETMPEEVRGLFSVIEYHASHVIK